MQKNVYEYSQLVMIVKQGGSFMSKSTFFSSLFFFLILLIAGCTNPPTDSGGETDREESQEEETEAAFSHTPNNEVAYASMINVHEEVIGHVRFYENENDVFLEADFKEGIPAGFHGFHIHENGICEANASEGPFSTAGGHYNPDETFHGNHVGDMISLYGTEEESAYLFTKVDRFTPDQLIEEEVAIIVHSDPDNFANIPERYQSEESDSPGPDKDTLQTGDAGHRISCGVVEPISQEQKS